MDSELLAIVPVKYLAPHLDQSSDMVAASPVRKGGFIPHVTLVGCMQMPRQVCIQGMMWYSPFLSLVASSSSTRSLETHTINWIHPGLQTFKSQATQCP